MSHGSCPRDVREILFESLEESGVPFALLNSGRFRAAGSGDVDIVIGKPPSIATQSIVDTGRRYGLEILMIWPSDVNTTNLFLLDSARSRVVQIDMTYSPNGMVGYGFQSDPLLARVRRSTHPPTLHPHDELLYVLRKAYVKGKEEELLEAIASLSECERETLVERADIVFHPAVAATMRRLIMEGSTTDGVGSWHPLSSELPRPRHDLVYLVATLRRYLHRARHPAGFLVIVRDSQSADVVRAVGELSVLGVDSTRAASVSQAFPAFVRPGVVFASTSGGHQIMYRWAKNSILLVDGELSLDAILDRMVARSLVRLSTRCLCVES